MNKQIMEVEIKMHINTKKYSISQVVRVQIETDENLFTKHD